MAYTSHVGEKFHEDGSVRAYPGVTVICFADSASAIYRAGERVQQALREEPYGHKFALLPPSSFHMTVFSLILDQNRTQAYWSSRLPLDTPLDEMDEFFRAAVASVPAPGKLRMCLTHLTSHGLLLFRLSPADDTTEMALHRYREALAEATGVRYPDHHTYRFHLTLAYQLMILDDAETEAFDQFRSEMGDQLRCEIGIFKPSAPMLTFFDDMFRFEPYERRNTLHSRGGTSPSQG